MNGVLGKYETVPAAMTCTGYQQISQDATTATALAPPAGSTVAIIQVLSQHVRMRPDGTDPTTAVGLQMEAGATPVAIVLDDLSKVSIIAEAGTAEVNVFYFG